MKILTRSLLVVLLIATLIGTAAAAPTWTRTVDSTTVGAGDSVHVTLTLEKDEATGVYNSIVEDYSATGWTISNIVAPTPFGDTSLDGAIVTTGGVTTITAGGMLATAGTYIFEYDLTVGTATGTYPLTGYFTNNLYPYSSGQHILPTGDLELTVTAPVDDLYDDVVELEDGATAQDALNATGLSYTLQSAGPHVFLNMEGYNVSSATSSYWTLWINDVDCGYNMANNFSTTALSDGDVVEFLYTTNGTSVAKVTVEANMCDPIEAVRNIPYETVYYGSSDSDKKVLVEVDITINEDLSSLTLSEILDPAFDESDVEAVELDGGSLNLGADNATFEILWSGNFVEGDTRHVEYTIFVDEAAGDYTFGDSFVDAYHMDDYLVTGEDTIRVTGDWNPWNDEDSDYGRYITTAEFQYALYCWIKDVPAPYTGADIDTSRIQAIGHFYSTSLEMGDNEE